MSDIEKLRQDVIDAANARAESDRGWTRSTPLLDACNRLNDALNQHIRNQKDGAE